VEERKRAAGAHTRWLPSRDRIRTVGTVQVVEDLTPGGGRSELFLLYTGGSRGGGSSSSLANDQKEGYRNTNRHCGKMGGGGGVQWRHRGGASGIHRGQYGPKRNAKERHGAGALVHTTHATASSSGCSKLEIGEDGSGEGEVQSAIGTKTALQLCQDRGEKMTRGRDC